jgi:4-amino-4-deoxy-L-arabinose transferase-like glycosyltransferase
MELTQISDKARVGAAADGPQTALDSTERLPKPFQTLRGLLPLILIVILGTGLRIYWLSSHTVAIEGGDGAEYARIAENLLKGKGYVGTMGGPELVLPPLYPLAIALFAFVTYNAELAGRLVSLLAGVCLIPLVFAIGLRMYGRTAALIGAFLAACDFVLMDLSTSILSEGLFTLFLAAGVWYGLRALERDAAPEYLFAGLFWGLAYLTRPEAMAFPSILALIILSVALLERRSIRKAVINSVILTATFLLIAVPYIAFLRIHTGKILLDGKHNLNYTIGQRLNSGMNEDKAQWGFTGRGPAEEGPLLDSTPFITRSPYSESPGTLASYLAKSVRRNADRFYHVILGWAFGAPILFFTAVGLFRRPWTRERAVREVFLLSITGFLPAVCLAAFLVRPRFIIPVLPFLLLWASNGIVELSKWAGETVSALRPSKRNATWFYPVVQWTLSLVVVLAATGARGRVPDLADISARYIADKEAGLRIQSLASETDGRIVDSLPILAYYARGLWVPLPSADSRTALAYIGEKHPSFVVVRGEKNGYLPYYEDWIERGIPDPRARLIYQAGTGPGTEIAIYRWLDPLSHDSGR